MEGNQGQGADQGAGRPQAPSGSFNPVPPKSAPLPIFGGVRIHGGPYRLKPASMAGVKMAAEIDLPCAVDIPTRDYSTPPMERLQEGIKQALALLAAGREVYAGCWGGIGRTGLFVACLAKAAGIEDPIGFTRAHIHPHALETADQMRFVADFDERPAQAVIADLESQRLSRRSRPRA